MAGFYPAIVLSRFKPVQMLQGQKQRVMKNILADGLVILQFSLATFLIITTLFVYRQFNFLVKTNLGYNDKNLLSIIADKAIMNKSLMDQYKYEFSKVPGVECVSYKNIGKFGGKTQANNREFVADYERIDDDYLNCLGTKLVSGRYFSKEFPSDPLNSILVNEAFAKEAGWKLPIGKTVDYMNLPTWADRKITVIGVVKDYHFESLKEKIKPQIFTEDPALPLGQLFVRLKPGNSSKALLSVERVFHQLMPEQPFNYEFNDELNRRNYDKEYKWKQIIALSAITTIFISCIGLLGLTILSTEKRTKEIGIRKVLGASIKQIIQLIAINFFKLILIAFFISIPISWYAIHKWLQNFAYRVAISWWLFALAGLLAFLIALITISTQTIKIALSNPVKALKNE